MSFEILARAVEAKFNQLAEQADVLIQADTPNLDEFYVNSFPPEHNKIFRERREHDCNCCKHFIRNVGNVVGVFAEHMETIWDVTVSEPYLQKVADSMKAKVLTSVNGKSTQWFGDDSIPMAGSTKTPDNYSNIMWDHFHVVIPKRFLRDKAELGPLKSNFQSTRAFAIKALDIPLCNFETVHELLVADSIYRSEQYKELFTQLLEFRKQEIPNSIIATAKSPAAVRLMSSAIGELLQELSKSDIETAVGKYEAMVAPANYKRTTALVTPRMAKEATKKVAELGVSDSLFRKMATDVGQNLTDFVSAPQALVDDPMALLLSDVENTVIDVKSLERLQSITLDKFIESVLPSAQSVSMLFEPKLTSRIMALTDAVDPDSPSLFDWGNHLAWAYTGDTTDTSITQRVKAAGGATVGDVRVSLAWECDDDLDLNMTTQTGLVYFGRKRCHSSGAFLDVDMNAGTVSQHPVENIVIPDKRFMQEGYRYDINVHNYRRRGVASSKFVVELTILDQVTVVNYDKNVREGDYIFVGSIQKTAGVITFTPGKNVTISASPTLSTEVWGVPTNTFVPVNIIMDSPNTHGIKHKFFILQGMRAEGTIRGFFNEFLSTPLQQHRKVFELLGSKMAIDADKAGNQLCGIGFNKSQQAEAVFRVSTNLTQRLFKVTI